MDLFLFVEILNALVSGVLRGGLYTALAIGLAITFGLLDIVVIAHPTLIVAASFMVFFLNSSLGLDPIVSGLILTPVFFVFGYLLYQVYYGAFERTGTESLRGLAFFFGLLFIVEVLLIITFGVDHRLVLAPYIGKSIVIPIGEFELLIAWRLLMPFLVAIVLTGSIHLLFKRTYFGRAVRAVAQDMTALRLMGVDPIRVKRLAFALGISTSSCGDCGEWERSNGLLPRRSRPPSRARPSLWGRRCSSAPYLAPRLWPRSCRLLHRRKPAPSHLRALRHPHTGSAGKGCLNL